MTTKYTKREKQMFVRQLKKAHPLIESGREYFVCPALSEISPKHSTKITEMIASRIYPHATVVRWLQNTARDENKEFSIKGRAQEYRLAWIDNMIEEFSK